MTKAPDSSWMISYVGTLAACYFLSLGVAFFYFYPQKIKLDQEHQQINRCERMMLASRYDGKSINIFCHDHCLRGTFSTLNTKLRDESLEEVIKQTYQRCVK